MARVAERVGVSPMALYRYFKDRDELVDEVVGHLLTERNAAIPQDGPWQDQLRAWVLGGLEYLVPCAEVVQLVFAGGTSRWLHDAATLARILEQAGYADDQLAELQVWIALSVGGYVMAEAARREGPNMAETYAGLAHLAPEDARRLVALIPRIDRAFDRMHERFTDRLIQTVEAEAPAGPTRRSSRFREASSTGGAVTGSGRWRWALLFVVAVLVGTIVAQSLNESAFTSQTITGAVIYALTAGSIYAIAASGLVVTYTTSGIFNFAQGAIGMIMAFLYWEVRIDQHWPAWVSIGFVVLVAAPLLGMLIERTLIRRLVHAHLVVQLVVTIGLMFFLMGLASTIWDENSITPLPEFFADKHGIDIGNVVLTWHRFITIVVAVLIAVFLRLLLYRPAPASPCGRSSTTASSLACTAFVPDGSRGWRGRSGRRWPRLRGSCSRPTSAYESTR